MPHTKRNLAFIGEKNYTLALFKYQHLIILIALIAGNDHFFTGFEAVNDFVILRVLATDLDFAAICFLAVFVKNEDPAAACALEECSARDDDAFCRLSKFQINVIGLSTADIIGAFAGEDEIRTELTVAHFRIDFAYIQFKIRSLAFECCGQSLFHAVDIMFVDQSFDLIVRQVVYLPDFLPGRNILA